MVNQLNQVKINNLNVKKDIAGAVSSAWHFCGSWVDGVRQVMLDNNIVWNEDSGDDVDRVINNIAFSTQQELNSLEMEMR
tara:strand:- start:340 stop:579 length:240 start_codon:yes stop_codon:yes gene_type:complete